MGRAFAWFLFVVWLVFTKLVMGTIYFVVTAEGLRTTFALFGMKLSKIPWLGGLDEYNETHTLRLAHLAALGLFVATYWMSYCLVHPWLVATPIRRRGLNPEGYRKFASTLGYVFLSLDAFLLYRAVASASWGGGALSLNAFVMTALWVALILCVALGNVTLHAATKRSKEE